MSKARWGLGALELSRQMEAMPGEIMVNSQTGTFAVKSYSGTENTARTVISYEYLNKVNYNLNQFKQFLLSDIYNIAKIDFNDYNGPMVLEKGEDYGSDTLKISIKKVTGVRFNIDMEIIDNATGLSINNDDITVNMTVSFGLYNNTSKLVLNINGTPNSINSNEYKYAFVASQASKTVYSLAIDSFVITDYANSNVIFSTDPKINRYKVILHSFFVAYKEEA